MENKVHSFKELNAYQKAKELVKYIYGVVNILPQEERYALAD
ncbi:MAG: four helix bundle protein [Bacteroidaceae bacterium]|nr:four helix bundle protein [Bacteroidaceae bacterium]